MIKQYSKELLNFKNKKIQSITAILHHNIELYNTLINETSFLNYNANIAERIWYIKNNIYEQIKCPTCKNNTKINLKTNKPKFCSIKCSLYYINPDTGISLVKERAKKTKNTKQKINSLTKLNVYESAAIKQQKSLSIINNLTGLTKSQEINKKRNLTLAKVDPNTGLTGQEKITKKRELSLSKIDKNGNSGYQKRFKNIKKSLSKIDSDTGLTGYQKIGKKSKLAKSIINPASGLTIAKEIAKKAKKSLSKIDPNTGLTGYQKKSLKTTLSLRKNNYQKLYNNFNNGYILLTTENEYINQNNDLITYKHNCGEIRKSSHQYIRCIKCYPYNKSIAENQVLEFCQSLSPNIISNSRSIIKPLELDIYIPNHNLGIEYNGLFWHSSYSIDTEDKNYHLIKTKLCREKNIQLLHIFENEWENSQKREIWKSIIKNKLNKSQKIFARKCEIKEISSKESKEFLENNHLQGQCNSSINIGLYYKDELVSLMTFGKSRFNKKVDWELLRFCNKLNYYVIGGASKLFKNFLKEHTGSIISYADMRYSTGKLYKNLGFEFSHISSPNYWYFKNNTFKLKSRIKYQKHKLKNKLDIFNSNLSEWQNMKLNGYNRIFDCGNQTWIYKNNDYETNIK